MATLWLALLLLLAQQQVACGSALPLWPLALELQGRTYELPTGELQRLELPLGCARGALALGVQHRVPALRLQQQCSGVLSVLERSTSGRMISLWSGQQVATPTPADDPALRQQQAEQDQAGAAPASFWFRFLLDPSTFHAGSPYSLQLAVYCGGQAAGPTLQSTIQVAAAAGCPGGPQALARPGVSLPGAAADGGSTAAARSRQLAEGDGVPVLLLPSSAGGAVLLDGYSGLARAINDTQAAPPCGAGGAAQGARCVDDPLVRTSASRIRVRMQLGGGGAARLTGAVQPAAFAVTGGAVSEVPVVVDGTTAEVEISLDGPGPTTVYVPQGALSGAGVDNAASNTLTIERDTAPPVPLITTPGNLGVTGSSQISFSIDFGEAVLATDPFALFSYSGASRLDAVLEVATGQLDIAVYIPPQDEGTDADISVWVPAGTVSDLVGNRNNASAVLSVKYRPTSSALQGAGVAANALLGTSLALCTSASYLTSHYLPFSTAVLGCGALSFVGWAQTFYLTGGLAAQWLPEGYKQVADTFGWTVGEISLPWADSMPEMNPDYAFPFLPVALTSTGQTVEVAQYPAVAAADLNSYAALVALTGQLSGLDGAGQAQASVLDGVPFLNPLQAQLVGAPPAVGTPSPSPSPSPPPSPTADFTTQEGQDGSAPPPPPPPPAGNATAGQPAQDVSLPPLVTDGAATGQRRLKRAPALPVESPSQRRRRLQGEARRGRRALLQAAPPPPAQQPAFEGELYLVASRGLQLMSPNGVPDTADVLVGGGAVQRAYDVIDAAGEDGSYPRQYYYDRLARTAFWTALAAFLVMVCHLSVLGWMMWRHAKVPSVMWFPRIEVVVCLAVLPGLAYGASGLFNCGAGDIALGAILLALLPCSFLLASFYLLWRWLQHPGLNNRRAIFVLRRDPLAAQIAAARTPGATPSATPAATPRDAAPGLTPRQGSDSAAASSDDGHGKGGKGGAEGAGGEAAAAPGEAPSLDGASDPAAPPHTPASPAASLPPDVAAAMAHDTARRWSFAGLVRGLCGARKFQGDWCGINLDSRFTFKYGPLFETTYGQTMARRRATYAFDPLRGKVDRGALVPLPELPTILWRGKALVQPHHLRTPAQLLGVAKTLVLAAAVSGVAATDSYIQCCLLILLYGFYAIYLLAVRPYNVALVGGFELVTAAGALASAGLAMAVMDGRGASDFTRSTVGTVMLILQLIGFLAYLAGTWWVALRAIWAATGLRRRLGLKPSPSDRFADTVLQVMARDPHILARKYLDRWMVRSLGVGLFDRPVWRRETEDLRRLLRATTLPRRRVAHMGSVVRRKGLSPGMDDEGLPSGALPPTAEGTPPSNTPTATASTSGSDRGDGPLRSSVVAVAPAFAPLASQGRGDGPAGDAVIAVASGRRSPPRELAAQPGTELHRQLSQLAEEQQQQRAAVEEEEGQARHAPEAAAEQQAPRE